MIRSWLRKLRPYFLQVLTGEPMRLHMPPTPESLYLEQLSPYHWLTVTSTPDDGTVEAIWDEVGKLPTSLDGLPTTTAWDADPIADVLAWKSKLEREAVSTWDRWIASVTGDGSDPLLPEPDWNDGIDLDQSTDLEHGDSGGTDVNDYLHGPAQAGWFDPAGPADWLDDEGRAYFRLLRGMGLRQGPLDSPPLPEPRLSEENATGPRLADMSDDDLEQMTEWLRAELAKENDHMREIARQQEWLRLRGKAEGKRARRKTDSPDVYPYE